MRHPKHSRRGRPFFALVLGVLSAAVLAPPRAAAADAGPAASKKVVIGRLERAWIEEADLVIRTKIDTGTQTASLHTKGIEPFQRDGKDWVRFAIADDNGKSATVERELVRIAKFKESGRGVNRRPVVWLGVCIATIYRRIQVNLVDRGRFAFPFLLGRRFLSKSAVVDVERKYTAEPNCARNAGRRQR